MGQREVMLISLEAAVPLWIERLRHVPADLLRERASHLADVVAEKGDVLQYGGKGCAEAFNAVAEGLAALAYCPGGVTFCGLHWEVTPTKPV
jgi:hypothetical protein